MEVNKKVFQINSLEGLSEIVDYLFLQFSKFPIYLLDGDLGAGKTTLIQFILRKLNYQNKVNSPTFGKIHEYKTEKFLIYHLDLYRGLPSLGEFEEILLQNNALFFIEWANQLSQEYIELIESHFLQIKIYKVSNEIEKRIIEILN